MHNKEEKFQKTDFIGVFFLLYHTFLQFIFRRSDEENCIPKHHECTHHKDECCKDDIFQYKCRCFKIIDDNEELVTKRCACVTPVRHQLVEYVSRLFKGWNEYIRIKKHKKYLLKALLFFKTVFPASADMQINSRIPKGNYSFSVSY